MSIDDAMLLPTRGASLSSGGSNQNTPAISLSTTHSMMTKYTVHTRTSNIDGAGACGTVRLSLLGEFRAEELELCKSLNHSKPFARGCEDIFEFHSAPLGILRSATVMLHNSGGTEASWHLQEIEVVDTVCMQAYSFACGQWIASDMRNAKAVASLDADGFNWISLRLKKPKQRPFKSSQDLTLYKVHVRTSVLKGSGTDANVFLSITGSLNSAQSLELRYDERGVDKFENGSEDVFEFHLPPLGDIVNIKVMHDNSGGFGSAWHLQDVEIIDTDVKKSFLFKCCQWLSKYEGPATIESKYDSESQILISLVLDNPEVCMLPILYRVLVRTSDLKGAGTDANVFLSLKGTLRTEEEFELDKCLNHTDKFERGSEDIFEFRFPPLGDILSAKIMHDNSGLTNPDWHLLAVEVVCVGTGASFLFACGQWLSLEKGHSIVEKNYESGEIRVGAILKSVEKSDDKYPDTVKTACIRLSVGNLSDSVLDSEICVIAFVLADHDDADECWNEIARTQCLPGKKELFWPSFPAIQYHPPSAMMPHGTSTLLNFIFMKNNQTYGNVKVTLDEILFHANARTGLSILNCADDIGAGVGVLHSQILQNLQPNLYFIGTRSATIEPKTVTFLNLRMMASNLPTRLPGAVVFASLGACSDGHSRELCRTTPIDGDIEPFWDSLPLQVEPPNKHIHLGLNTAVRVTIMEKSAEFGEQKFGTVTFQLHEALKLATLRRGILLEPDGALDANVTRLLEPRLFFFGTYLSFALFDPGLHGVLDPRHPSLLPHPPSDPPHATSTNLRKMSRARIIREFDQRQTYKDTTKSAEVDAKKIARATAVISRVFAKFMHQARKVGGPNVKFLSFFKSRKSRAVILIQSGWRAHVARAKCCKFIEANRLQRLLQNRACVRMQCAYRGHLARCTIQRLFMSQRNFRIAMLVVKVQARFRGILGRYRAKKARHEHHHRLKLQMYVRRWLLNKKIQNRRRNNAASLIQRNVLVVLGTYNAMRYAIAQRRYAWQGMFMILWVVVIGLLSFLTMKSSTSERPLNARALSVLASQSENAAPIRSYVMFETFLSHILPELLAARRNSSISLTGSPYWRSRAGGNYNRMFLPATMMFVPIDAVTLRLRRLSHYSNIYISDELLPLVTNVSNYIYTSTVDRSDMKEPGFLCSWSEVAGPAVGCSTCSMHLPPEGNLYSFNISSDPIALNILQGQGWDLAGVSSVALDVPFFSVLSPVISIMTISVQTPDTTGGSGLSHLTTSWQTRSITTKSWFAPSPYPAAVALSVCMALCAVIHVLHILRSPKEWIFRRKISIFRAKSYMFSFVPRRVHFQLVDIFIEHVSSLEILHRLLILLCFIYYAVAQYELTLSSMVASSEVQYASKLMSAAVSADTWSAAFIFLVWIYGIHWVASVSWGIKSVVILRRSLIDIFRLFVSALPLLLGVVHCAIIRNVSCGSSRVLSSVSHLLYDFGLISSSIIENGFIASPIPASVGDCSDFQWFWMFVALAFRFLLLPCVIAAIVLQMFCPFKDSFSPVNGLAHPEVRWRTMESFADIRGQFYFIPWFRWPLTLLRRALRTWATSPEAASLQARRDVALSFEQRRPPSPFEVEEEEQYVVQSEVLLGMGSTLRALARAEARVMHRVDRIEETVQTACEKLLKSAEALHAHSRRAVKGITGEGPAFPSAVLTDADIVRGELTLEYRQNKAKFDVHLAVPLRRFHGISKAVHELGKATERFGNATDAYKGAQGLAGSETSFRRRSGAINLPGSLY